MKRFILVMGLLCAVAFPCYAKLDPQDSLRLEPVAEGEGEVKLNPEVLQELEMNNSLGTPKAVMDKSWMDFDNSLPVMPKAPEKKVVLTLRPYTANTKYNWDPIYQKKIKVDKDTWRGDEFYALKILMIPTNWAKHPFDAGPRETVEQIEATGLRYRVTERANNMAVGGWQGANGGGISGLDLMTPFTREFWNFKGRKRRARTLEVLKAYGDSITVLNNSNLSLFCQILNFLSPLLVFISKPLKKVIMNRVTSLFGIRYPIIQGGMVWCSGWRLASAVSNAGGLGLIGAGSMHPDTLREHIRKCNAATKLPFWCKHSFDVSPDRRDYEYCGGRGSEDCFYLCRKSENVDWVVERAWNNGCSCCFFFPFCCKM